MKTKICKYCKESIAAEATKCPKCQSFQSKFRSPNFAGLISALIMLFFLIPMFKFLPGDNHKYIDYKDQIEIKVLKIDTLKQERCKDCNLLNILVELDNKTDIEWENGEYEVEFSTAKGELLNIEKYGDFQLKLHPNSKSKSSIKVPIYQEYRHSEVQLNLIDLRHNRY